VQLRQDNALETLWNMVGFQTKLKHAEQVRIFRTIPGLENAQFARLGGLHRNTFINSPRLLDAQLRLKSRPSLRFAGQVTGVEGYVESAAIGLLAGRFAAAELLGAQAQLPPPTTAFGALLSHITGGADARTFQPMNVNFGLFPGFSQNRQNPRQRPQTGDERTRPGRFVALAGSSANWLLSGRNRGRIDWTEPRRDPYGSKTDIFTDTSWIFLSKSPSTISTRPTRSKRR
jgi:methylenetetrahydrofolate--tRNA-(uracil-5-)-methyltransferase